MAEEPLAVYLVIGQCRFCECDRLATPDRIPIPGSPVICGSCCGLMIVKAERLDGEWVPCLEKPGAIEGRMLLKRRDVQRIRDTWRLEQIEASLARHTEKPKVKNVTGRKVRTRSGDQVRLELRGPDA